MDMAYAPADDPKIAIAMVVENAGFGGANSAPIARRVFDFWLKGQYPSEEDLAAVQLAKAPVPIGKPRTVAEMPWPAAVGVPGAATAPATSAAIAAATATTAATAVAASATVAAIRKPPAAASKQIQIVH